MTDYRAAAARLGYYLVRGGFQTTCDNRLDGWYTVPIDGPVGKALWGPGHRTQRDALRELREQLRIRAEKDNCE